MPTDPGDRAPDDPPPAERPRVHVEWLDGPEYEYLFDRITRLLERVNPQGVATPGVRLEAIAALERVLERYDVTTHLDRLIRQTLAHWRT